MKQKKEVTVFVSEKDGKALIDDGSGQLRHGHIRVRAVNCGSGCAGCPHKYYKYAVWRDGKRVKEKYIGVLKDGKQAFQRR